jgi:hypothetical protein
MKKIIKGPVYYNVDLFFNLLLYLVIIWKLRPNFLLIFISLFYISLLEWFFIHGKFHYFLYDEKEFIIKNSWNPFIKKVYNISEIRNFEIITKTYMGGVLKIIFKSGSIKKIVCNISKEKLAGMINDIFPDHAKKCPECGALINTESIICLECGVRLK